MLSTILKLYTTTMAQEVRSPIPHLFGPPGCGKSTFVEQAAELLGVQLHTINVSRISPLELEGVQMPDATNSKLNLLTAIFWTRMKDGDILLLDEFLRGFPEVYNGLLDILTSRQVGGYKLPNVFIIAASNSTVAYDKALEDRLIHLPVPDIRKKKSERERVAKVIVEAIGLMPEMVVASEMNHLIDSSIAPMYKILDSFQGAKTPIGAADLSGYSARNLIGQAKLRHIVDSNLEELLNWNNLRAIQDQKFQYVVLPTGKNPPTKYVAAAEKLRGNPRLTQLQAVNLELNLQLIKMEEIKKGVVEDGTEDPF